MGTRDDRELIASPPAGERPAEWAFRPDIEGLRAVAVVLVVLFHVSIGGFAGGFVGVDVFFVISGFLITGLLLRELEATGSVSLSSFYARRARRLLPAAALVLLVTLAAAVLVLPPLRVPGVATDVAAAALYVSNLGFALKATDYFAATQAPSPILHYWSLGVEEQFYLFWPALLLLLAGLWRGRGRSLALAVAVISVASFAFSLWLTSANAPWAFYSLPTRAWELGLGAILAVAGTRLRRVPARAATVAGWLGLGLIVLAAVVLDEATPFPGWAALLPTLGAALVIVSGAQPTALGPARLLGTAAARFFGRISYSLYLWHWPLLVLPAVAIGAPLPLGARLGLVVVAILMAAATQRWVEEPFRHGRVVGTLPRRNLAAAGALALVVALVAVGSGDLAAAGLHGTTAPSNPAANEQALDQILNELASPTPPRAAVSGGLPPGAAALGGPASGPPSSATSTTVPSAAPSLPPTPDGPVPADLQPSLANAPEDYPVTFPDGCNVPEGGHSSRGTCLYGNLASKTTIALFGDSHAAFWFPAMEGFAERQGWRLLNLTMSSCTPADLSVYNSIFKRIYSECPAWREQAIARLIATRPAVIVVAGTHGISPVDAAGHLLWGDALTRAWEAGMTRTLDRLAAAGGLVILMADTPTSKFDPPTCLSQHLNSVLACATPVARAIDAPWLGAERLVVAQTGVGFIDPTAWVCPSSPCPAVIGNLLVYQNAGHLTAVFAFALADRLGGTILQQMQDAARPGALKSLAGRKG